MTATPWCATCGGSPPVATPCPSCGGRAAQPAYAPPPPNWAAAPPPPPLGWTPPPPPPGWTYPPPPPGWTASGQVPPADTALQPPIARTALTIGVPIVLAGIYQLFFNKLGRTGTIANEAMGRYVLAGTVALYVGVALILIAWLHSTGRRLVWHRGDRAQAVAIGAGIGTGLGLLAIAVNSAIAGQLSTDPRAVFYVSEGDLPHILVTLALMAIAAPVVEEILFRGILMEWLRPKGAGAAFAATAVLFAVWHFNGKELRYYAVMGVILGALFWKRGLLASMTAHAVFNGSLATVAVVIALTPAQFMSFDGISFTKPQGWHAESAPASEQPLRVFAGPSGAAIAIAAPSLMGYPNVPDAVRLAQDIRSGDFRVSGAGIDASAPQLVNEPYGEIVELPFRESGMPGAVYYVPTMEGIVRVVTDAAGSARAQRGIDEFLSSLRFDPVP